MTETNDDLIERLNKELVLMLEGSRCCLHVRDIRDIIAALSPVLPADVQKIIHALRVSGCYDDADLIERLARENASLNATLCNDPPHAENKRLQARIKKLESELALASKNNNQQTT